MTLRPDGAEGAWLAASQDVEGGGRRIVDGQVDDEALAVTVGQLHRLERHAELADLRMADPLGAGPLRGDGETVEALPEGRRGGAELGDEHGRRDIAAARVGDEVGDLLVGDRIPVGIRVTAARIGERVPQEVRRRALGASLDGCSVSATVDIASLDTGNPDRDAHVLSHELLDVARRPTMAFRSTVVRGEGEDWKLDGDLTIGDVTRPVTLDVEFGGVADFPPDGTRHAGFEARGELRRKDFGIDFGAADALLGQKVAIELDLEFIEPA